MLLIKYQDRLRITLYFVSFQDYSHNYAPTQSPDWKDWVLNQQQRKDSPSSTRGLKPAQSEQNIVGEDIYSLPAKQEAVILIDRFFATTATVFPWINKSALLSQYHQARGQRPPRFRRASLALLNIIWAHASNSSHAARAERFYQRASALLDSKTLRGSSVELG